MAKRVSAGQAKAHLSALVSEVAYGGQHIIVERRGKPLAALVSREELERLERERVDVGRPQGALAFVGAWSMLSNEEIDEFIAHVYAEREKEFGRPVELGD